MLDNIFEGIGVIAIIWFVVELIMEVKNIDSKKRQWPLIIPFVLIMITALNLGKVIIVVIVTVMFIGWHIFLRHRGKFGYRDYGEVALLCFAVIALSFVLTLSFSLAFVEEDEKITITNYKLVSITDGSSNMSNNIFYV